ncbi:MAG: cellulase family glycosylhydrolase [Anaerolineae bacterium]|nr:cellulase family glycosylhydrolase [Anaerolineae bacterium]
MSIVTLNPAKAGFLDPSGQPLWIHGVNYEGFYDRAWAMWRPDLYDPGLIAHDFQKARASGFNSVRFFVQKENLDEVNNGNFTRFDTVFNLAREHGLYVLLTFNDYHSPHLADVGRFNSKIVTHFKGNPIVLGWDLENEPRLYNLLVATYPDQLPPLLTSALVDAYGELVSRAEMGSRNIPGLLRDKPDLAYYYVNAVEAYVRYSGEASAYHGTLIDYMRAPEAQPWQPFLQLLDQTIAAWLKPQLEPMKAADPTRLFTIGWNWPILAALPANRMLDFHQIHQYGNVGYDTLQTILAMLRSLRDTFPDMPVMMGEYGYSTDESKKAETSRPVDPRIVALHEAATLCFLRAEGLAGGHKWMLNDVRAAPNPFEAGLGLYANGDLAKPSQRMFAHLATLWRNNQNPGQLALQPDERSLIRFVYRTATGGLAGGSGSSQAGLNWQTPYPAHLFLTWLADGQTRLESDAAMDLEFAPSDVVPDWPDNQGASVYRLYSNTFNPEGAWPAGQQIPISLQDNFPRLVTPLA